VGDVIPVLNVPGRSSSSGGGPVPNIDPVFLSEIKNNEDLMKTIFKTGVKVQGSNDRIPLTVFIDRGGVLPPLILEAIRTMSNKGTNLYTRNKLGKTDSQIIGELMGLLNSGLGIPEESKSIELKGGVEEIKLQTADQIDSKSFYRILYEVIGQISLSHGVGSPIKGVQASALLKAICEKMTPEQINRILAILNAVDINALPISESGPTYQAALGTYINRAGNVFRNLPVDRQTAIVFEIRKIMRETANLTPAQSNYLQERDVSPGQQGPEANEVVESMTPLFNTLEDVFMRAITLQDMGLTQAQAQQAFVRIRPTLENYYNTLTQEGDFSPETQAANFESIIELFMTKLAEFAKNNNINRDSFEFNPTTFLNFVNSFLTILREQPAMSFQKLKQDIDNGDLTRRLNSIYNRQDLGRVKTPSDVLTMADAVGDGYERDDNLESPEEFERFINNGPPISVLRPRDIQSFANQLMRDAAESKRNMSENLMLRVRNFRVYAGRNFNAASLSNRFSESSDASSEFDMGEYYGVRRGSNVSDISGGSDFDVVLEEERPDGSRIRRFLSLKNLAYLLTILGFGVTVVGTIIQSVRNQPTGPQPPIPIPPIPLPPVNPPVNPPVPVGPDTPVNPPTPGPGPVPVNPITPVVPVSPDINTPTVIIPGKDGNKDEINNADWGEGTERQYFQDPNELELLAMTRKQQEQDFRNFTEFSLFQPNNGLGNARTNPLIRENIKDDMRRFKNNFTFAQPVNTNLLLKDRPIKQTYSGRGCMNFTNPVIQCDFGRVHFEDENVNLRMSNTMFQPDYETQYEQQLYLKNGLYNADRGLYKKGVNQPNYKPVKIGESSRNSKHFGLPKDYRQDELSQKSYNINNQDSQINDYGRQIPYGFNFGNTREQDFPTETLLKTNLYSGLRYSIGLKKK